MLQAPLYAHAVKPIADPMEVVMDLHPLLLMIGLPGVLEQTIKKMDLVIMPLDFVSKVPVFQILVE